MRMNGVLRDLSVLALVEAIKANLFGWLRYLGSSPKAELHDSPELTRLLTGLPTPTLNAVLRTRAEPGNVDAIIEKTVAHFRSRGVTRFCWWIGPDSRPTDLAEHLVAHGLTYREGGAGMAVDLLALNEDLPAPAGLAIEHVEDTEGLGQWARASFAGIGLPETSVPGGIDLFAGLGFDLPLRNYLGILNGEPVATSQLFLGAGVVGIYVVSTVPWARRKGIGTAMTLAALRDACDMGFRVGILHSSPMGLEVYRRLGFQEYCRMSHFG